MKILVTLPLDGTRDRFFPSERAQRLQRLGEVAWNPHSRQYSSDELADALPGCDVCVSGWNVPRLEKRVLDGTEALGLVAHVGGTVAPVVSEELYQRGVMVSSANRVLARYVAEGILAYALAMLRGVPRLDRLMHSGTVWPRDPAASESLYGRQIGFVGLGTVGRFLLDLLRPFEVSVLIHDPYIADDTLAPWPFARRAPLEAVLRDTTLVSVHASLTPETYHLLNGQRLGWLVDGALLINAARGAIVDETALIHELSGGRIRAVLDVFSEEPLPVGSALRQMNNVVLMPHLAGAASHPALADAMVREVERFAKGEPLEHAVTFEHFQRMTRPLSENPGR